MNEEKIVSLANEFFKNVQAVSNGEIKQLTIQFDDQSGTLKSAVPDKTKIDQIIASKRIEANFISGCVWVPGVGVVCF